MVAIIVIWRVAKLTKIWNCAVKMSSCSSIIVSLVLFSAYFWVCLIIFVTNVDLVNIHLQIVYYGCDESFQERIVIRSLKKIRISFFITYSPNKHWGSVPFWIFWFLVCLTCSKYCNFRSLDNCSRFLAVASSYYFMQNI